MFLQRDFGLGRVKLPGGMDRVANGDPGMPHHVDVVGDALHFLRLEIERIAGNQQARVGTALELQKPANVFEGAAAGGNVEMAFIALQMLVFEIKDDMALHGSLRSRVVILDVIGSEAHAAVSDVHIVVGNIQAANAALGSTRGDFGDAAGRRVLRRLLRKGRCGEKKKEQSKPAGFELADDYKLGKEAAHAANQSMKTKS